MMMFRQLWWFFKMEKKSYLIGISTLMLLSLTHLVTPYTVRVVVDAITADALTWRLLVFWTVVNVLVALCKYGLGYTWRVMLFGAGYRMGRLLRDRLYQQFTRMSPRFYHQRRTGDMMAHATNDIQAVVVTAGEGVLTLADSFVSGMVVIVAMFVFIDWQLALISLLPMPLIAVATQQYGKLLHQRFHLAQEAFSRINDKVQENIAGVRVVKAFGQEEAEKQEFKRRLDDVVEKNLAVARVDALFDPTIVMAVGLSMLLAVVFGSISVADGRLTIGQLLQFTLYLGQLVWPMLAYGILINIVERGRASYERIQSLLNIKPDIEERPNAIDEQPVGDIRFNVKSFTYPDAESAALTQIRVCVKRGGTLGIVGKTGSGKSTLLRLMLREFDVTQGEIRIGHHPITDYTLSALRGAIGYVPQDHVLFSATVAQNIAFGNPKATREQIEDAAKIACVHEDILQFAEGYDTVIGERGVTVSGGQKQRLSIARALLLNPEILILDDVLSAVDAKTEHAILQALRQNRVGKTTLISAHRLSAVEHADTIIVLDEGRIIQQGTHEELMQQDGWYRHMFLQQQLESQVLKGGEEGGTETSAPLS
ncbi:ABC transporter transmembrane domain-containing protein [Laceyella tengchongensis]